MHLNLQNCRWDLAVLENFTEALEVEVAHANVSAKSFFLQFLHGLISHLVCDTWFELQILFLTIGVVNPFRRVPSLNRDVLKVDGEVNQIKIEVIKLEIFH